ncbi:hypothetical protein GCM10007854_13430 [Algimonas porphyrae]|uniref:Head-tail adaptor protein n=1 Tax=Algimonas porphyrae TaxID=1128113 RepID=A0ABQ5UYL7_9PROT|nr:hypothetical protein GCM10007854_13430 [Algimonas porphyrae]
MDIGALDRRVTIQTLTATEDALGTPVETWSDAQTLSAAVSYGTASERRAAAQEQSALPATFTVRSSTFTRGLTPGNCRLVLDGLTYDVEGIAPGIERRTWIALTAIARTS